MLENIWGSGEEYYFLYNSKEQRGVVCDQTLLKALSAFERIQDKNHLTLETVSEISRTQYREITAMMQLQKGALEEVGKDISVILMRRYIIDWYIICSGPKLIRRRLAVI